MDYFDWRALLESVGVEYVERGPNVARGHVNIRCPLCGPADPSHHFGIRLRDGAWGCFRSVSHRGKSRVYLVQLILGCSPERAREVLEKGKVPTHVDLDDLLLDLEPGSVDRAQPTEVEMPTEFVDDHRADPGRDYLADRGLEPADLIFRTYGMRYARGGDFNGRLILPIRLDGRLVGWTGRAIGRSRLRYKTHPPGEATRNLVYNFDRAVRGGRHLFLVEGPLDAVPVDFFGYSHRCAAVGLLGISLGPGKLALVERLTREFDRTWILLDAEASAEQLDLASRLSVLGVEHGELPPDIGDPGELTTPDLVRSVIP